METYNLCVKFVKFDSVGFQVSGNPETSGNGRNPELFGRFLGSFPLVSERNHQCLVPRNVLAVSIL